MKRVRSLTSYIIKISFECILIILGIIALVKDGPNIMEQYRLGFEFLISSMVFAGFSLVTDMYCITYWKATTCAYSHQQGYIILNLIFSFTLAICIIVAAFTIANWWIVILIISFSAVIIGNILIILDYVDNSNKQTTKKSSIQTQPTKPVNSSTQTTPTTSSTPTTSVWYTNQQHASNDYNTKRFKDGKVATKPVNTSTTTTNNATSKATTKAVPTQTNTAKPVQEQKSQPAEPKQLTPLEQHLQKLDTLKKNGLITPTECKNLREHYIKQDIEK